jgi:anti-sigma28 factor (negative regulator of flagellin synthesis)
MNTVNPIGNADPLSQIAGIQSQQTSATPADAAAASPPRAADRLELSGVSYLFQSLKSNDVRTDLVASIRGQIDAGTYETEDKLNSTADKLLDEVLN